MAYEDDYDGIRLGTRPWDIPGEDSFGAYASQEYDDDIEDREISQFENNRVHRGHAVSSLNSMDGVGRFVLPHAHFDESKGRKVISYCDHLDIYRDFKHKIDWNPQQYKIFDGIIDEGLRQPVLPFLGDERRHDAIGNPQNQYYEAYGPLRQNISVLRNALYTVYFPDGEYNPEDPQDRAKRAKIHQIARKLSRELKWQGRWQWLSNVVRLDFSEKSFCLKRFGKYGQEHFGAQKMYEMLYNKQEALSWNPINWFKGQATRYDWDLPHPEESPFCQKDMREAVYNDNREQEMGIENCSPELCDKALYIEGVAAKLKASATLGTVAEMNEAQREESVELAREILRKLRNVCAGRSDRAHDGMNHQAQDLESAHLMSGLAENYLQLYQDLLARDPSIQYDSTFERARIALGKLGHLTMLDALANCDEEQRREYKNAYDQLPAEYKKVSQDTEEALLRDVEVAIEEVCRRQNIGREAAPQVKSNAKAAVMNLHNTMSNARIQAVSANAVDKAKEVTAINEQRQAKTVEMTRTNENDVGAYRA